MASLTENSLISDMMKTEESKIPKKNDWFDRVYLCYEDTNQPNTCLPIKGFKCYRYNNYQDINVNVNNHIKNSEIRHTMIPICKWVPKIFDKYILNWELRNMYWLNKHTIYRRKFEYKPKE